MNDEQAPNEETRLEKVQSDTSGIWGGLAKRIKRLKLSGRKELVLEKSMNQPAALERSITDLENGGEKHVEETPAIYAVYQNRFIQQLKALGYDGLEIELSIEDAFRDMPFDMQKVGVVRLDPDGKEWKDFDDVWQGLIPTLKHVDYFDVNHRSKIDSKLSTLVRELENKLANERGLDLDELLKEKLAHIDYVPSVEEVKIAFSGDTDGFVTYCKETDSYEVITQELVESCGNYLADRVKAIGNGQTVRVLEVGAGNGRFAKSLKEFFQRPENEHLQVEIIPTDLYGENWEEISEAEGVLKVGYEEALQELHPQIVISSWMPPNEDWTPVFRHTDSVREYILLGQDDGTTGGLGSGSSSEDIPYWDQKGFSESDFYRVQIDDSNQKRGSAPKDIITESGSWVSVSSTGEIKDQLCINDKPPFRDQDRVSKAFSFRRK